MLWSLEDHLTDPAVCAVYGALEAEDALIRQLIDLRIKRGLSQRELAKRAGMQQPTLARVESDESASVRTLRRRGVQRRCAHLDCAAPCQAKAKTCGAKV